MVWPCYYFHWIKFVSSATPFYYYFIILFHFGSRSFMHTHMLAARAVRALSTALRKIQKTCRCIVGPCARLSSNAFGPNFGNNGHGNGRTAHDSLLLCDFCSEKRKREKRMKKKWKIVSNNGKQWTTRWMRQSNWIFAILFRPLVRLVNRNNVWNNNTRFRGISFRVEPFCVAMYSQRMRLRNRDKEKTNINAPRPALWQSFGSTNAHWSPADPIFVQFLFFVFL